MKISEAESPKQWFDVSVAIDGRAYRGQYAVASNLITVNAEMGCKIAPLSGQVPEVLARELLRALVRDSLA